MRRFKGLLIGAIMAGLAMHTWATEGGGGAYASGGEGTMTGALPPPGLYLLNYMMYYDADSFRGDTGNSAYPEFNVNVFAEVVRLVNVTPYTILGGNWAQHLIVPVVYMDATVNPAKGAPTFRDHKIGLGDVDIDPFIIGWHKPPFHWIVGIDTYVPTGKYDSDALANIGRNYWTFEPIVAGTYLNEAGIEVSAKVMYDFNTENQSTDYRSGQEFHTDFAVLKHFGDFAGGVGGYWYQQTTDDKRLGTKLDACRGRVLALGPEVSYGYKHMSFVLSCDHEFEVENRPQGDVVWFKCVIPL